MASRGYRPKPALRRGGRTTLLLDSLNHGVRSGFRTNDSTAVVLVIGVFMWLVSRAAPRNHLRHGDATFSAGVAGSGPAGRAHFRRTCDTTGSREPRLTDARHGVGFVADSVRSQMSPSVTRREKYASRPSRVNCGGPMISPWTEKTLSTFRDRTSTT